MKIRTLILATAATLAPFSAGAGLVQLPGSAHRTAQETQPLSSYRLPVGGWSDGKIPTIETEGAVSQQAWQFQAEGKTTLQILAPLRKQLQKAGFDVLFECDAEVCGGFDFRYATDVLPEPEMHVDLGDYRFLSARRTDGDTPEYVSLMVSRSSARGFVQVMHVGTADRVEPTSFTASTKSPTLDEDTTAAAEDMTTPLGTALDQTGRAVLSDLDFGTGSSQLGLGQYSSLKALARYLLEYPDRSVTLVGHTDSEGALDTNMALSRKRAESVRARLVQDFNVPADQIKAQGVGYLAPVASNLTDDGRMKNRRVEVILTSTQ
ncbi:MAG: OmpA family protein [Paracoccaceae bacterium]